MKLYDKFCKLVVPHARSGDSVVFWLDRWQFNNEVVIMQQRFPRLHSFVIDDTLTIKDVMELPDPTDNFHLPLSVEAFEEFNQLQALMPLINLHEGVNDVWKWPSRTGDYRSRIYYLFCFSEVVVDPIFGWIWKCSCTLKLKVFGWLLLMDRLNTRDMMQ